MEKNNEMMPVAFDRDFAGELVNSSTMFTSMKVETIEDKKKLYNAMNNPTGRIGDMINMTLNVVDVYCETVKVNHVDEKTGVVEEQTLPRIVFITDKGESYQAVSTGIYNALKKLIAIFGPPTWEGGVKVKVKQIQKGTNNILTLEL